MNRFARTFAGLLGTLALLFPFPIQADGEDVKCPTVVLSYVFRVGLDGQLTKRESKVELPGLTGSGDATISNLGTLRAVLLVNAAHAIRIILEGWERGDEYPHPSLTPTAAPVVTSGPSNFRGIPLIPHKLPDQANPEGSGRAARFADALLGITQQLRVAQTVTPDLEALDQMLASQIPALLGKMEKLAGNIRSAGDYSRSRYDDIRAYPASASMFSFSAEESVYETVGIPKGMTLQSGGQQDVGAFWAQIDRGQVPASSTFFIDGFLKEFKVPLTATRTTTDPVAADGGVVYDPRSHLLYLQASLTSAVTEAQFKRPPVSLMLAIDKSGSMNERDGGRSRLQWAQEAALKMLGVARQEHEKNYLNLTEEDDIGLVVFDHNSEIVVPAGRLTADHRDKIIKAIEGIKLGGSTDVLKAMDQSYEELNRLQVSRGLDVGPRDRRVLVLTDCENNTGSDDNRLIARAHEEASKGNGITILGMGARMNDKLARELGNAKGGFYFYASSGQALHEFMRNSEKRLSPFAYDFKAIVAFQGFPFNPRLVATYGINADDAKKSELIQIPTFRFADTTGGGGGGPGIMLVYDTRPQ